MTCRANSTSKSTTFQPMPMAVLIANLKALPAAITMSDSSDSSDESSSSHDVYSKKTQSETAPSSIKMPLSENRSAAKARVEIKIEPSTPSQAEGASNKENVYGSSKAYRFPGVDVLPTIEASTSQSMTVESLQNTQKHAPVVEKKQCARYLFSEPAKAPPTPSEARTSRAIPPPVVLADSQSLSTQLPMQTQPTLPTQPRRQPQTQPTLPIQPRRQAQTPSVVATPSHPAGPKSSGKIQFKTINVKGKKYMVTKKLGTGGSSEVFKILEISTSNDYVDYAMKCVDLATDRELAQGYLNEVKLLRALQKCDRVITLYDYEYDRANNCLRLVMEVGDTDLACFLRAHRDGAPPVLVLHYWDEMLRAVQQIHQHGIVHADLKPANFLLVSGRLKLIDFGIASAVSSNATSVARSCRKGTFSYISPEALGGGGNAYKVSFYSDVWSLGCILYSLIYGHTPFAHLATSVKVVVIADPNHTSTIQYPPVDCIPPSLMTALQSCLRYDAHSRPTVTQLLQMRHLQCNTRPLPERLLHELRHVVTPEDFALLQKAKVYDE